MPEVFYFRHFILYSISFSHPFHTVVKPLFQHLYFILVTTPDVVLLISVMVERTPAFLIFFSSILQIVRILINIGQEIILMIIEVGKTVT